MERRPTESEKFVNRVNGKEPAAWEELYARYYKALCAYSASLTGDAAFAEDLVQELLLRMWQSDRTFSVLPELAAYLYRSVYRNSLAYRRDRSNRESLLRNMHEQSLRDGNFPPPRRSRGGVRATCIIGKTKCDGIQNQMRLFGGRVSPKRKATKISHTHTKKHRSNGF